MEIFLLSFSSFLIQITIKTNGTLVNWTGLKCKENVNNTIKIKQLSRNFLKITRSNEKSLGVAPLLINIHKS